MDNQPPSSSASPKRFFDIVPARKTRPDATSRPIITAHGPERADPMMRETPTRALEAQPVTAEESPALVVPAQPLELSANESEVLAKSPAPPDEPAPPAVPPEPKPTDDADKLLSMPPLELPQDTPGSAVVAHHHSATSRRTVVLIILIILLAVIVADLTLDVGLIKSTLPHTHFFGG